MSEAPPLDPERIFAVLDAHRVEYVVIGGLAVQVHGHVRMTNDVDLIPAPTPRNLARLAEALTELDARVLNPGSEELKIDAQMLPRATLWQFSTPPRRHRRAARRTRRRPVLRAARARARDRGGRAPDPDRRPRRPDPDEARRGRPVDLADIAALTEAEHRA